MGCNIHFHAEVKVEGKWEHYAHWSVNRNYGLFAKMAGVRNYNETEPIAQPRGLPEDMSVVTRLDAEHWKADGHSHSFLNAAEIAELEPWAEENCIAGDQRWRFHYEYWGYLFGNSWAGWTKYPDERPGGVEDVRFVFWFDN